ncbi:MAG: hypothetical protein IPG87_15915 [Saprospiraceae bacterium]|nr:hypothetical protein [Candidatus Vicinibacter affinis]
MCNCSTNPKEPNKVQVKIDDKSDGICPYTVKYEWGDGESNSYTISNSNPPVVPVHTYTIPYNPNDKSCSRSFTIIQTVIDANNCTRSIPRTINIAPCKARIEIKNCPDGKYSFTMINDETGAPIGAKNWTITPATGVVYAPWPISGETNYYIHFLWAENRGKSCVVYGFKNSGTYTITATGLQ